MQRWNPSCWKNFSTLVKPQLFRLQCGSQRMALTRVRFFSTELRGHTEALGPGFGASIVFIG